MVMFSGVWKIIMWVSITRILLEVLFLSKWNLKTAGKIKVKTPSPKFQCGFENSSLERAWIRTHDLCFYATWAGGIQSFVLYSYLLGTCTGENQGMYGIPQNNLLVGNLALPLNIMVPMKNCLVSWLRNKNQMKLHPSNLSKDMQGSPLLNEVILTSQWKRTSFSITCKTPI